MSSEPAPIESFLSPKRTTALSIVLHSVVFFVVFTVDVSLMNAVHGLLGFEFYINGILTYFV